MLMREPNVEFVSIDMEEVITAVSRCSDDVQRAAMTICDCNDDAEGAIAGCQGDIV